MFNLLSKKKPKNRKPSDIDSGLLVFEHTSEVIRAEQVLKKAGFTVRVMGPPPEIQTGCDLVIEFPLMEELDVVRRLEEDGSPPLQVTPVTSPLLSPVALFHTKEYDDCIMVRAANMKMTIDRKSLEIVNISGGGCPDVPFLAHTLVGKKITEAPSPRELGHTLCGYALELAYQELRKTCLQ